MTEDKTIENLLELEGVRYVVDEYLGFWVKFEARLVKPSDERPHGVKYSLSLHDRSNKRVMGFDNAHAIEEKRKKNLVTKKTHYHWHKNEDDHGRPYHYENAGKLLNT